MASFGFIGTEIVLYYKKIISLYQIQSYLICSIYQPIRYNSMPLLYNFDIDTPDELLAVLANNLQKRRLEKGLSREALTELSGVPTPTIAKFEQKHTISLASYVALAKALGYSKSIKELLSEPLFSTMEELEMINRNKNRKKGRNEIGK